MTTRVALITGGASGMGLATAQRLAATGVWTLHLVDLNQEAGDAAVKALSASGASAHFHAVNVTSYESLSGAFEAVFKAEGRLDFVFANAGIVERHSFYEIPKTEGAAPPPPPNLLTLDINLNAVVTTAYLALHYFRQSPHKGQDASLVMTASCGGLVRFFLLRQLQISHVLESPFTNSTQPSVS
jgi:NAD(P)-dependent dehydrogenase (short-subunit alcohol dehydrogenase family)